MGRPINPKGPPRQDRRGFHVDGQRVKRGKAFIALCWDTSWADQIAQALNHGGIRPATSAPRTLVPA